MIDLTQAISSEPDYEPIQIHAPTRGLSHIFGERLPKGPTRAEFEAGQIEGMGISMLVFGVILLFMSLFLILNGYYEFYYDEEVPPELAIYGGKAGLIFSFGFILLGWLEIKKNKTLKINKIQKPDSPWLWKVDWDLKESKDDLRWQFYVRIWVSIFCYSLVGSPSWYFITEGNQYEAIGWFVISILTLADLIFISAIIFFIYKSLKFLKYGITKFKFSEFPFFVQESIKGQLENLPKNFYRMTLDLRFIQQDFKIENSRYVLNHFQLYKKSKVFKEVPANWDGVLLIDWPLPDNKEWSTILNEVGAKYWELEVKADTSGIDYHSRFVLPVYAKPLNT